MEKYIINPQKTKTYQKFTRFFLVATGVTFYIFSNYFTGNPYDYLLKLFGLFLFIPGVMNPFSIFGGKNQLILTEQYIELTDEMTLTRTAYWNKINKAVLTRFAFRVFYSSGTAESFKIPYISRSEFEKLRSHLIKKSEEHNFHLQENPWWKIF